MTDMFDPGEQFREAIEKASASARAAAEKLFEQTTASSRGSAERLIEQATGSSRESIERLIEQATASNQAAIRSLIEHAGVHSTPTMSADIREWSAGSTRSARDVVGAVQQINSSWAQAAATVRAALGELAAAQAAVSGSAAATPTGGPVRLAVHPVRAGATAGRPLLSVPAASAVDEMDTPDLRVLLRKLISMLYTAASNPALQFAVATLINLVMLVIAIMALHTSQAAYELARENAAEDRQREVTAPSSSAQPAPVTAVPGQRELDDQERAAQLDPGR